MRPSPLLLCCAPFVLAAAAAAAPMPAIPADYQDVLSYLGRKGDFHDNVLKIDVPRGDLKVSVAGIQTPTPFGFGGWVAMTKGTGGMDVMMGDLVLLQNEVNPVMSALLDHGLAVTALHNHFFWEQPRIFYMHVHGHGNALDLAHRVKPALDLIGKGTPPSTLTASEGGGVELANGPLDTQKLDGLIGAKGQQIGPVYKFVLGRDDLNLAEMGAKLNARMGLNTWAAFLGSDRDAIIAGDVAMLGTEVQAVLRALRANGLDVVAIHQHMIGTSPEIIFLHYWGRGPADKLARGFQAALGQLGKAKAEVSMHH